MLCKKLVSNTYTQTEIAMRQLQIYYRKSFVVQACVENHFLFGKGRKFYKSDFYSKIVVVS